MHVKCIEKLKKCLYGMQVGEFVCKKQAGKRRRQKTIPKKWLGITQEKRNVSICNGM